MRGKIINISLSEGLLRDVDAVAEKEDRTRSELFRVAVRTYLDRQQEWDSIFRYGRQQARKLGIKQADIEGIIEDVRAGR